MRTNSKLRSLMNLIIEVEEITDYEKEFKHQEDLSEAAWSRMISNYDDDPVKAAEHTVVWRKAEAKLNLIRYIRALEDEETVKQDLRAKGGVYRDQQ